MLTLIWAQGPNGELGLNGMLPWYVPEDLAFFKRTTENATLIMGRRTFKTLPKKVLDRTKCIVLSKHDVISDHPNVRVARNSYAAYDMTRGKETFVIGGLATYNTFMHIAERLIVTRISLDTLQADTCAPNIDNRFHLVHTERLSDIAEVYYYRTVSAFNGDTERIERPDWP